MAVPFDHIASTHDSVFAENAITQLQRKLVWRYLEKIIPQLQGTEILELTKGSPEDAMVFSEGGFNMVATDISSETMKIANKRPEQFSMHTPITSFYLDTENLNERLFDKRFDLVISNFGDMNSVSPLTLQSFLRRLPAILNPGGRFIGILKPQFCAWESLYFLTTFQLRKILKRISAADPSATTQDNALAKIWYYQPSQIKAWTVAHFKIVKLKPIGFCLPPLSLSRYFQSKNYLLRVLNSLDDKMQRASFLSGMSDYFLIDLQLR